MQRISAVALILSILLSSLPALATEGRPAVRAGTRVRVSAVDELLRERSDPESPAQRLLTGTLAQLDRDGLKLWQENGTERAIPLDAVRRLEQSTGTGTRAGAGAVFGFLLGAAGGIVATALLCDTCSGSTTGGSVGNAVLAVGLTAGGALVGTATGALIGSSMRYERWEEIPPPYFAGR